MRWKQDITIYAVGNKRVVRKFLWWPRRILIKKTLANYLSPDFRKILHYEWHWLEFANIEEEYHNGSEFGNPGWTEIGIVSENGV